MVCNQENPNCNQEARHEEIDKSRYIAQLVNLTEYDNSTPGSTSSPFNNNLGGNNPTEQSNETITSNQPNYVEVNARAGLLFITETVGVGLSVAAGIITTPAGPEVSIPSFFLVYKTYHEITLPVFILGAYMIYDGLNPR
jgi:hypothetical protein